MEVNHHPTPIYYILPMKQEAPYHINLYHLIPISNNYTKIKCIDALFINHKEIENKTTIHKKKILYFRFLMMFCNEITQKNQSIIHNSQKTGNSFYFGANLDLIF